MSLARALPDFPWDTLAGARHLAFSHPDGVVDLSVGTPVDATPSLAKDALVAAAEAPGYPTVWGAPATREAIISYMVNRWRSIALTDECVMPVIGTKELVGWLPELLGLGAGDAVVFPECAYPTYAVGAQVAGTRLVPLDDPAGLPADARLIWINSPANPSGEMLSLERLRACCWPANCISAGPPSSST